MAVVLHQRHPAFFDLSCDDCQRWQHIDGKLSRRAGSPHPLQMVPRIPGTVTPCHKCPKIPHTAPAKVRQAAIDPTPKSKQTMRHYFRCKAVGRFPSDPIVERNAGIIHEVVEALRDQRLDLLLDMAAALAGKTLSGMSGKGGGA